MERQRYDWPAIKAEYVTGTMSAAKLAQKHGAPIKSFENRMVKDGWVEARKKWQNDKAEAIKRRVRERGVKELSKVTDASSKAVDIALKALNDEEQLYRYLVTSCPSPGIAETVERRFNKLDTKMLRDIVMAIKELAQITRDLYGLPTQAQEEAQRIAAERLALDKQRADAGVQDVKLEIVGLPEEFRV